MFFFLYSQLPQQHLVLATGFQVDSTLRWVVSFSVSFTSNETNSVFIRVSPANDVTMESLKLLSFSLLVVIRSNGDPKTLFLYVASLSKIHIEKIYIFCCFQKNILLLSKKYFIASLSDIS